MSSDHRAATVPITDVSPRFWWRSPAILLAILLLATGLWVGVVSIPALAIVVIDGGQAVGIIVVAALAGGWLVYPLGLGRCRWSDRLMIGAGLGVGLLSLVVLTLGSASWLTRPVAFGLVAVVAIAGVARFAMDLRAALLLVRLSASSNEISRRSTIVLQSFHYLWLLTIPFFAITLLAASIPPGVLWAEEACGYDVLEYHLAVPREFFEAGHIGFLPHNVYSNFPMNSEMLSLLMMSWQGSAIDAVFLVQMANVAMAVLFVAAAWWAGRCFSSKAGVVAGVLAAMTPWLAYLAGVAYVEPGMLAMGMLSLGAVLRAGREASTASIPASRWIIAAGLLAGLSAGYKYTAIPLIVVPIATVLLFMLGGGPVSSRSAEACSARRMPAVQLDAVYHVPITGPGIAWPWRWAARFKFVAIFSFAAVVAFSPWMIRNFIHTHDPIFPLAYSVIGAKAGTWDDESQARWQYAHGWAGSGLDPNESRIRAIWQRTAGDARMGAVLPWLAVAGMFVRRDRWTLALLVMLALQFGVWLFATHLFARFAVVFVLPLLLLAARFAEACRSRVTTIVLGLVLVAGAVLHGESLSQLYNAHPHPYGYTNGFVKGLWPPFNYLSMVNELEGRPKVLLVGEARSFYVVPSCEYAVVFNRQPLADAIRRWMGPEPSEQQMSRDGGQQVLQWLRSRGITHVLVDWAELLRLQRTYGMDPILNPAVFAQLESAGLVRVSDWSIQDHAPYYATLYEVPNE